MATEHGLDVDTLKSVLAWAIAAVLGGGVGGGGVHVRHRRDRGAQVERLRQHGEQIRALEQDAKDYRQTCAAQHSQIAAALGDIRGTVAAGFARLEERTETTEAFIRDVHQDVKRLSESVHTMQGEAQAHRVAEGRRREGQ